MKKGSIALGGEEINCFSSSFLLRSRSDVSRFTQAGLLNSRASNFLHPRFHTFFRLISYRRCVESPKVDFLKYLLFFLKRRREKEDRGKYLLEVGTIVLAIWCVTLQIEENPAET